MRKEEYDKLEKIRNDLYRINAVNISLYMVGMKKRDDKIVYGTNECIAYVLENIDKLLDGYKLKSLTT